MHQSSHLLNLVVIVGQRTESNVHILHFGGGRLRPQAGRTKRSTCRLIKNVKNAHRRFGGMDILALHGHGEELDGAD